MSEQEYARYLLAIDNPTWLDQARQGIKEQLQRQIIKDYFAELRAWRFVDDAE